MKLFEDEKIFILGDFYIRTKLIDVWPCWNCAFSKHVKFRVRDCALSKYPYLRNLYCNTRFSYFKKYEK